MEMTLLNRFEKFQEASNVPPIPKFWNLKGPYRQLFHNNVQKKAVPPLKKDALTQAAVELNQMMERYPAIFNSQQWRQTTDDLKGLINSFCMYAQYLEEKNELMTRRHDSLEPTNANDSDVLKLVPARKHRSDGERIVSPISVDC